MLHLYDLNHIKKEGLTKYKDLKIERTLDGIEFLSFSYPFSESENIQEEAYIRTEENEYVIKEIDDSSEWISVTAKINLDKIKGKAVDRVDVTNTRLEDSLNLAIAGTGYTATIYANKNKRRTTRKAKCSALEVLDEIRKVFRLEYRYDTINKKVYVYEKMGSNKGSYFTDALNLRKLNIKSNTYDFATRIIPLGKDGMTIESVNGGKNYVENYQYSNKIVEEYWEDNRYTDEDSLKEDAIAKLDDISKRVIAYEVDVIDLANASKDKRYKVLDYDLGDTIELKSRDKKVKELQRIVKVTEFPDEPYRNSCEIANRVLRFEDMQQDMIDSSETVDTMTNSDGTIDGSYIESIDAKKITNLEVEVLKAVDLSVINADIRNLKADKADINDLNVAVARIGTLEVTKATITDLNVVIGKFERLEASSATITQLEAATAKINVLEADSATIKNLVAGNLTAENIQAGSITAGSGIIADGAIGNAQISSLSVDKLESGIIDTSRFTVQGSNGRLKIHNNLLQVFSGSSGQFERVALGDLKKDGTVFGLRVRGADGTTVLLDESGLTNVGFTDGYEKLADDSLDPKKLDIKKVINRVNADGSISIDSTKVIVGNKTLDVELSEQNIKTTANSTAISSHTTSINANTDQIALKLDTQVYNSDKTITDGKISTNTSNLTKATTDISAIQGEILLRATKTEVQTVNSKIDNLEIGGRNLLPNSSNFKNSTGWSGSVVEIKDGYSSLKTIGGIITENNKTPLKADTEYIVSAIIYPTVDIPITSSTPLHTYFRGNTSNDMLDNISIISEKRIAKAGEWTTIILLARTKKEILPNAYFKYHIYYPQYIGADKPLWVRDMQFREGNKPIPWEPAQEDLVSEAVSSSESYTNTKVGEIKVTTDAITQLVASNTSSITTKAEKTYVDGQISTVNTAITSVSNKAASLETNLSGITGRVSSTETAITDVDSKIDNLEIGGRNLLLDSEKERNTNRFISVSVHEVLKDYVGEDITVGVDLKINTGGILREIRMYPYQRSGITISNERALVPGEIDTWERFYLKAKVEDRGIINPSYDLGSIAFYDLVGSNDYTIKKIAIYLGHTVIKSWTPAPEDLVEEAVSTSQSYTNTKVGEINVTTDAITGRVSSTEGSISTINGEVTALNTRVSAAELKITDDAITTTVETKSTALARNADLSMVKTRVANAESKITQQADQILLRVTKDGVASAINQTAQSVKILASKINLVGAVTVLSNISGDLGSIRAGTLNIGNNAFKVDADGWLHAGRGGFSVPPNADGIYNAFTNATTGTEAARWKYLDAAYIYQSKEDFRIYTRGTIAMEVKRLESHAHTGLLLTNYLGNGGLIKTLGLTQKQFQFKNVQDTDFIEIAAKDFKVASSAKIKKDITYCKNKLDIVKDTPVFNFRFKNDDTEVMKTGFIVEDSPQEIVEDLGEEKGISITNTVAVLWKAVQEISKEVDILKGNKRLKGAKKR